MPHGQFDAIAAEAVYTEIAQSLGIDDYALADWGGEALLRHVLEPRGWLGPIMLYADEVATVVLGQRLWEVAYQANQEAVEGVLPVPLADVAEPGIVETYRRIPHPGVTSTHAALIHRLAILHKLDIDHDARTVRMRPPSGVYPNTKPLEQGDFLPFPEEDMIVQGVWRQFIDEASASPAMAQLLRQAPGQQPREA